jgi:DNA-binding IclR family transcriptional regulator
MPELNAEQKAILEALAALNAPAACGEIAKVAGLPTPKVVGRMRGLLAANLVERPVEGKYVISALGRTL